MFCSCRFVDFGDRGKRGAYSPGSSRNCRDVPRKLPTSSNQNLLLVSTIERPNFGSENSYGILEFRLSDLPDPILGAWLQLSWNAVVTDIVLDLYASKGDGQLTLSDFALGQPVVSFMPYYTSASYITSIDISRQIQQAQTDNNEFIKFTLSTQMDDRFVSFQTDQYPGLPLGIVTELPDVGQIVTPVPVPEPSGFALSLLGAACISCGGAKNMFRLKIELNRF